MPVGDISLRDIMADKDGHAIATINTADLLLAGLAEDSADRVNQGPVIALTSVKDMSSKQLLQQQQARSVGGNLIIDEDFITKW